MQKARRCWLMIGLWALVGAIVSPSVLLAATCVIGDETQGAWYGRHPIDECLFPGTPATGSPWPINAQGMPDPQGMGSMAYRIEGKYKLSVSMGGDGFRLTIPSATQPECITGLAEAHTTAASINYQRGCPESGCGRCSVTAQGTLLTMHSWDCNGYNHYQYLRLFEATFYLEEWGWTNKECNKPAPTSTPNPDPGDPTCPQVPL